MSRPPPQTYKTRNWPAYNKALKRRGSLTIWFDLAMTWEGAPNGKRGRQRTYSDTAIQTCLTMKVLFGMALRQTTGFVESLLGLIGLDWSVPDFATLSRRQRTLMVNIPYRGSDGPLHLRTGYEALDKLLERLHRRKSELLKVLNIPRFPCIPTRRRTTCGPSSSNERFPAAR